MIKPKHNSRYEVQVPNLTKKLALQSKHKHSVTSGKQVTFVSDQTMIDGNNCNSGQKGKESINSQIHTSPYNPFGFLRKHVD